MPELKTAGLDQMSENDVLWNRTESELAALRDEGYFGTDSGTDDIEVGEGNNEGLDTDHEEVNVDIQDLMNLQEEGKMDEDLVDDDTDDEPPDTDTRSKQQGKTPAYANDPKYKAAVKTVEKLNKILEAHGLDDIQDLADYARSGMDAREVLGDMDIKEVIDGYNTLAKFESDQRQQAAQKQYEDETPEETIQRQNAYIRQLEQDKAARTNQAKQKVKEQQLLQGFEDTVSETLEDMEGVDKSTKDMAKLMMGIGNTSLDIPVDNRKAVRSHTKAFVQKLQEFVKASNDKAVQDYVKGKRQLPKIQKNTGGGGKDQNNAIKLGKDDNLESAFNKASKLLADMFK